jgi:hypothetical protein
MNQGKYVFSQLMSFVSHNDFKDCVKRYKGDYKTKHFSCWNQFLCMAFGQLTQRESLSDTMLCLTINPKKLYHLGIGEKIVKSTLSKANENRDYRIYQDFALLLIENAKHLYRSDSNIEVDLKNNVFALDATVVHLCLSLFNWAHFRQQQAAIKIHTLLDLKTSIPNFIQITNASVHEVNILEVLALEEGSFYIMDRGYLDTKRLYRIHLAKAFFIIRAKRNTKFKRVISRSVNKSEGVMCDQMVKFVSFYPSRDYPEKLRRIKYYDKPTGKRFIFLTNNDELTPLQIASLSKDRWKIELFFKWLKQHLKIKSYWGHSPNAVKTQIWIAIAVYTIVAIIKKKLKLTQSMYEILQILSTNIFDKTPLNELFSNNDLQDVKELNSNQLILL